MRHYKVTRLNEVSGRAVLQGSCGVDIPVTLRWTRDTPAPVIITYPNYCPDSKALLHYAPAVSDADLVTAWYDAVNERVSDGMVADPFDLMDARD